MLPSISPAPEKPSLLSALKNALTQSNTPAQPTKEATPAPSLSLKGLYSLVLGPKPSAPQEPHLIGQRPVLNQFQDPLSASLNRMRLILPVSDGGGAVAREAPSTAPAPKAAPLEMAKLELPKDDRTERRTEEQQQRLQEYQLAQMPLESHRRSSHTKEDLVFDATGRPIMRRGHSDAFVDRMLRGIGNTLALSFSLVKALLTLPIMLLPLQIRARLPNRRTAQTPRMRAPR